MRSAALIALFSLVAAAGFGFSPSAPAQENTSAQVTGTIVFDKKLDSFAGRTLEIRLYQYDPRIADKAADLVEKIVKKDYRHTQGQPTSTRFAIGSKAKLNPRRRYYLTVFVLDNGKRTHIGEKDGKRGLCSVLTGGHPREVRLVARQLRK